MPKFAFGLEFRVEDILEEHTTEIFCFGLFLYVLDSAINMHQNFALSVRPSHLKLLENPWMKFDTGKFSNICWHI